MFDKLFDFIFKQINHIIPFAEILQFNMGIRFRFGKTNKILGPGWHFKLPYIDKVVVEPVVLSTLTLPAQSVISKEGVEFVVKGTVVFIIKDIDKYINTIYNARDAIADRACMVIREVFKENEAEECRKDDLSVILTERVSEIAKPHGIYVFVAGLTDITNCNSLRLFNENTTLI